MKKGYVTPQLIVLHRGKPEDTVLSFCKYYTWSGGPVGDSYAACYYFNGQSTCANCSYPGVS